MQYETAAQYPSGKVIVILPPGVQWPPPLLADSLMSLVTTVNSFLESPLGKASIKLIEAYYKKQATTRVKRRTHRKS